MQNGVNERHPMKTRPQWTLGDRVRKAREHRGWTQRDLSSRLGVSLRTISRWERGDNRPGTGLLVAVAHETGVPISWLLGDDGEAS